MRLYATSIIKILCTKANHAVLASCSGLQQTNRRLIHFTRFTAITGEGEPEEQLKQEIPIATVVPESVTVEEEIKKYHSKPRP